MKKSYFEGSNVRNIIPTGEKCSRCGVGNIVDCERDFRGNWKKRRSCDNDSCFYVEKLEEDR